MSRCTPGYGWTSRRRRAFKQYGASVEVVRAEQIATLTGNQSRAGQTALRWLLENPSRFISAAAMKNLGRAFSRLMK